MGIRRLARKWNGKRGRPQKLELHHELFILAMHAANPKLLLRDYCILLRMAFKLDVSKTLICHFFRHRFKYKGGFRKASLVPIDKYKDDNKFRYVEFIVMIVLNNTIPLKMNPLVVIIMM